MKATGWQISVESVQNVMFCRAIERGWMSCGKHFSVSAVCFIGNIGLWVELHFLPNTGVKPLCKAQEE